MSKKMFCIIGMAISTFLCSCYNQYDSTNSGFQSQVTDSSVLPPSDSTSSGSSSLVGYKGHNYRYLFEEDYGKPYRTFCHTVDELNDLVERNKHVANHLDMTKYDENYFVDNDLIVFDFFTENVPKTLLSFPLEGKMAAYWLISL